MLEYNRHLKLWAYFERSLLCLFLFLSDKKIMSPLIVSRTVPIDTFTSLQNVTKNVSSSPYITQVLFFCDSLCICIYRPRRPITYFKKVRTKCLLYV